MGDVVKERSRPQTVAAEYERLSPAEFGNHIADKWNFGEQIVKLVTDAVTEERITPMMGGKLVSCAAGELFGYAEFHGGILNANPTDIVEALKPYLGGSNSTPR